MICNVNTLAAFQANDAEHHFCMTSTHRNFSLSNHLFSKVPVSDKNHTHPMRLERVPAARKSNHGPELGGTEVKIAFLGVVQTFLGLTNTEDGPLKLPHLMERPSEALKRIEAGKSKRKAGKTSGGSQETSKKQKRSSNRTK